ncbi:MAG: hypothetical protein PUC29_08120 [Clostridia bacterium]|nr:hypothetical protein [Clostridia bacterium]
MKKLKCLCALLLTAVLIIGLTPAVFAAQPSEKVTVYFSKSNIYSIDGTFSFSNPGLFTSVSYSTSGMVGSAANNKVYMYSADKATATVGVTVTVSPSAKEGDSCTITFEYETSDVNGNMTAGKESKTVTVSIPKPPANTDTNTNTNTNTGGNTANNNTAPAEQSAAVKADTTELQQQIAIAEGLKRTDYTSDSWKAVNDTLYEARLLLESTEQAKVDSCADALAQAIKGLVKMDFSKLKAAIEAAKPLTTDNEIGQKVLELSDALKDSVAKLASTNQAEVDAAAEKLDGLAKEVQTLLDGLTGSQIVEVEKTVEVEVEPKSPFCNITAHKVWPVLFFVSLAINIALVTLIVLFVVRKKRARVDTTPLVDYDIGDDEPDNNLF